ncbi:histidine phosphatase family protein [Ancrocorticia populi]|uniref:histidine phosphatase family protein n=1 Tax=Ancrocorticia populi TaxID=2175228 RepID=UPI002357E843|nr:histidine phosphatase family protein [Ancrocorticia populi]
MKLRLIRHGQTPNNVARVLDTAEPGALLTELGHDQALTLPDRLAGTAIDSLYVSTLTRTHLTAAPLAQMRGMEPLVRSGIREVQAGSLEGGTTQEAFDAYFGTIVEWFDGDLHAKMGGGETGYEVLERFDAVVSEAEESGADSVAFVSHGSMISTWSALRGIGISKDFVIGHHPANTGIVELEGTLRTGYRVLTWMGETPKAPSPENP